MKIALIVKLLCLGVMVLTAMASSVGAVESDVEGGDLSDDERRDPTYRGRLVGVAKGSSPAEAVGRRRTVAAVSGESEESEGDSTEMAKGEAVEGGGDDETSDEEVEVPKKKETTVSKRLGPRGPRGRRRSVAVGVKRGDDEDEDEDVVPKDKAGPLVVGDVLEENVAAGPKEASGPTAGVPIAAGVPVGGGNEEEEGNEDEDGDEEDVVAGRGAGEPSWTVDPPADGRKRWFRMTIPSSLRLKDVSDRSTAEEYSTWSSNIEGGPHTVDGLFAPFYLRLLWWSKSTFTPLALHDAIEKIIERHVAGAEGRLETRMEAREKAFFRNNKGVLSPGVIKHLWETSGERNSRLAWEREIDEDTRAYRQLLWLFIAWHYGITGSTDKFPKRRRDDGDDDDDGDGGGGGGPAKRRASVGGGRGGKRLSS